MTRVPIITLNTSHGNETYYGYIYLIVNNQNGKCYVGQKQSSEFVYNYWGSSVSLSKDISDLGLENFSRKILCWAKTKDELNYLEEYWIKELDLFHGFGYNNSKGGNGLGVGKDHPCTGRRGAGVSMYGKHHTPETRKRMSESHKGKHTTPLYGEDNPFYGKHHTEETKRKISESNKGKRRYGIDNGMYGKHHTDEAKQKIRQANIGANNHNYGKHMTDEAKEKQRLSHLGKKLSDDTKSLMKNMWKKPITKIDMLGNVTEYPYGALSIGRNFGISGKTIWNICIENSNQIYEGCYWKFT